MTASALGFPAVWLRHNCRCPECLDPVTGQRLIEVTAIPDGRITAVRLNNRSMEPLRLPYEQAEAAYAAYRAWASLLGRPEFLLTLRLAPGDCLIFDNPRVLHSRTAFAAPQSAPGEGAARERHLQGCYADIDGLLSTLAVLRRADPKPS